MDDWALLGHLYTRSQPIFPLSIPQCHHWLGSSPIPPPPRQAFDSSSRDFPQFVAQLLSFPIGCAWARTVPGYRIFGVSLNPGPFSLKEHVVITVMATVGSSSAY